MASKSGSVTSVCVPDVSFPLSAAQTEIYLAQNIEPSVPFTIAQYVVIDGELDVEALIRASDSASRELESPTVRLFVSDGVVRQWADAGVTYALKPVDFTASDDPARAALAYMDSRCREPVDMLRDQLVVAELLQVGVHRWFWFSRAHHVVMDGLGAIALLERTAAVYSALTEGRPPPPGRSLGVRELHEYEQSYEGSTRQTADRTYWSDRQADRPERVWLSGRGGAPATTALTVTATVAGDIAVGDVIAAFVLYLARTSDTDDVVVCLPVSCRPTAKLRASSSMMSNVVPMRVRLERGSNVGRLRDDVRRELTGALRHQRFRAVDQSSGPTVNIMAFADRLRLGAIDGEYHVLSSGPVDDIMVNVYPGGAGSDTRVDFLGNPRIHTHDDLTARHGRFLETLNELAAACDDRPLESVAVSPNPIGTLATPVLPHTTLIDSIRGNRNDTALSYRGVIYTYDELNSRTADLANRLVECGVGPEVRVAVAVPRSDASVIACLAVARAGGSFVPVDRDDPRMASVLAAAGVRIGVAAQPLPDSDIRWIDVGAVGVGVGSELARSVSVDNEAYLLNTSGTTGAPKGVSVTHRGLAALVNGVRRIYRPAADSRVLHLASPVFDASIQEMVTAFAAGATLVVAPAEVESGAALAEIIAAERITHLITAPAVLATLSPEDLDGVEVFDVGGDVCPPALRDRFAPGRTMLDAYGPTEATVLATVSAPMVAGTPVTIGSPLPGVRVLVLDRQLRRVGPGCVGEIYIGGDGVARGYDGRFTATAAKFVADPDVRGARLYRTGDRVRTSLVDDTLEFLGRNDTQVKVNGRRIELGEIEATLVGHESVLDAVVTLRGNSLVAFVVRRDPSDSEIADLDTHVRTLLPTWMVPSSIVELDALPLTAGGKPDRAALRNIEPTSTYAEPRTSAERVVAKVFADVLGVSLVGRDNTFFELGGDSLSATTVLARLGSAVTLSELFRAPTVSALGELIEQRSTQPEAVDLSAVDLSALELPDRIPLSPAQQRIWVVEQFENASPAYIMPVVLRLPPATDGAVVGEALRDVLRRHDILRTYFPADEIGPRQVVVDPSAALTEVPRVRVDSIVDTVSSYITNGFDVTTEVPLRAVILDGPDGSALLIVAHHLAVDGASIPPLIRDFAVAYTARRAGRDPELRPLTAQYAHYAVWNRSVGEKDSDVSYWKSQFPTGESPAAYLPPDLDGTGPRTSATARTDVRIGDSQRIGERAAAWNITPFMLVHTAFAATLARFSGIARTVVGTPSAGRGLPGLDDMVGMFVGTVPLVVDVDTESTLADLTAAVARADIDALHHGGLPFDRIVDTVLSDRISGRHPLFQIMLSFDTASMDGLPFEVLTTPPTSSEFDLHLVLSETRGSIGGHLEYSPQVYLPETVQAFLVAFARMLDAVLTNPSYIIGEVELPTTTTESVESEAGTLLDVLHAVDLDGATKVSAFELESRSNRLARVLIAHGARPEATVALSLERSAEYVVAMWAVLKAGAAFVPVDPNLPAARREVMLRGTDLGIGGCEHGTTWISESDAGGLDGSPVTDRDRTSQLLPDHPAYVVHTSGSTGVPKPVVVTHNGAYSLTKQVVSLYRTTSASRVMHGYSIGFDAAVLEIVLAFGAGATLVIAPPNLMGGRETSEFLTVHRVTHFLSTPAVLATVAPVDGVEVVAVGGDVLPRSAVRVWEPGRRMLNAYGPTESTVVATVADDLADGVTIGRTLASVDARAMDARMRPAADGAVGELYLGGSSLARGYRDDPARTASRFVAAAGGRRWYRTGDMVRRRADGRYVFLGRSDSQVQLRGVRTELGDVESVLMQHPLVDLAVADVRDGQLVAWVVGGSTVDVRAWATGLLPAPMVPTTVVFVDSAPVTANGKVDRASLALPAAVTTDNPPPRSLAEDVILGVLADLLYRDDLGVEDNFFAHGGDSLIALRAVARIGAALRVEVSVRTLFEAPSARALAAAVDTLFSHYVDMPILEHLSEPGGGLSPAEHRMWLQNRLNGASGAYNLAVALALPSGVDLLAVRAAAVDVVERHSPLRTVYGRGPEASVWASEDVVPHLVPREGSEAVLKRIASTGFDLATEVPVRFAVVDTDDGRELLVVAHHIAVDGFSVEPLIRDATTALAARIEGRAPTFAPLEVDYSDYRRWQHSVVDAVAPAQLEFWARALRGVPDHLDLPTGTKDPDVSPQPVEFSIDESTAVELYAMAHRLGATPFVVIHAAVALILADLAATDDVVIGTPVSGRIDPRLDDLVGMFVDTVVLRTHVDRALTFEQFVTDVRDRDLDAFSNSVVPFETVVDHVAARGRDGGHPLFGVLLSVFTAPSSVIEVGGHGLRPRPILTEETQFDLEIVAERTAHGFTGTISYAANRFGRDVVERVALRLVALMEKVIRQPSAQLRRIDVLGTDGYLPEHRVGVSDHRTLDDVLTDAVSQWPHRTAVVDAEGRLTYRELDARVHAVSTELVLRGAGPGTTVALVLPRSLDHVIAAWAVARTGAAFLPIDPALPEIRIVEIIAEAEPVVGVSRGARHAGIDWITPQAVVSRPGSYRRPVADDAAYVIYTSGSTGAPKGVRVTGRGIANLVRSQRETFGVTSRSRVLNFASPGFDASVFEMLLAAGAGAALVVTPQNVMAGRQLEKFLTAHQVTHVCLTPAVLAAVDAAEARTVTTVVMAGDTVNSELVQRWAPGRSVYDAYGPTEVTIMGTCSEDLAACGGVTIGRPIRGFDASVLDASLRQVPDGVVGELYLAGTALADGYVARSPLTASRFVPDLHGKPGTRMYRTGDNVRWRTENGRRILDFLGRSDAQLKIRGHRVEPAEIESVLLRHPSVEQASVQGVSSENGTALAGFVVGAVANSNVRAFLAERLPSYMVPSTVHVVDALPLSIAGKVDPTRLPGAVDSAPTDAHPSTELEHVIRAIFADVLELDADTVGVDADFFELGGHSLAAVRVVDALERTLSRPVPVGRLFVDRTVTALASRLDASSNINGDSMFEVMLPLAPDRPGVPTFCVHPAVGVAWSYASLTRTVNGPVYGLQLPGLDGNEQPPERIEDYAARYAREIRAVQPNGPFALLGWSLGGVIAHAVATALQAHGGVVTSLILIDAHLSAPTQREVFGIEDLARQLGTTGHSFEAISDGLRRGSPEAAGVTSEHMRRMYRPVVDAPRLVAAYAPEVFVGDTIYISARGSDGASQWQKFVDRPLRVRHVDAEHDELLGPVGARAIGEELRAVGSPPSEAEPGVGGDVHP